MPGESISNTENTNSQEWAEAMAPIVNEKGIRTEEYEKSDLGQAELDAEAHYDALEARLNKAVEEGRMSEEAANRLLENQLNRTYDSITDVREQYEQNQKEQAEARNGLVNVLQGVRDAKVAETESVPESTVEPVEPTPEPVVEAAPEQAEANSEDEFKKSLNGAYEKIDKWLERGDIDEAKAQELRKKVEADLRSKMEAKARLEAAYENIDNMVKNGQFDEEQAAQYKAQIEEKYKIEDEYKAKTEAEDKANEEARLRAEEEAKRRMEAEAEARAQMEAEARAQAEAEARAQMEAEARAQAEAEAAGAAGAEAEDVEAEDNEPKENVELYAINAEALLDKKQILADTVDKVMEKEVANARGIKRLFIKLFKNKYREKIERELKEDIGSEYNLAVSKRRVDINHIYARLAAESIDDILAQKGKEDMLEKADEASTNFVKEAIGEFVEKVNKEEIRGLKNQKEAFNEFMKGKRAAAKENGVALGNINNYFNVALQALELTHHGAAMDKVMEGFKLINVRPKTEREIERTEEITEIAELINNSEELLGGSEGKNILIQKGAASEQDTAPDGRYRKWWDSLSDDGKAVTYQILAKINEINANRISRNEKTIDSGAAIMSWLEANAS